MRLSDFDYELPPELIAQAPLPERAQSRLLVVDGRDSRHEDRTFAELPELLEPGDLLVINDTRVIPARLRGVKESGGRIEMLLERVTGQRTALAQLRASRAPRVGATLHFEGGARATVEGRSGKLFELLFDRELAAYLESHGEVPLPPYIARVPADDDVVRYQTVYADTPGAVAAPTAGLHFDAALFEALADRGIGYDRLTLHVGLGTFSPVDAEDIRDHRRHAESVNVSAALCARVEATKARGGRVVAVGTTTVRALETAARGGSLAPFVGETRLFILPGFKFRVVDAVITNFHVPRSSLLMLVAAFAGRECVLSAYRHAVAERYRFFSYGDAMLVLPALRTSERDHAI
jgi:S-adenosylmethionine:tRNA ribosyltransferase-isomerase